MSFKCFFGIHNWEYSTWKDQKKWVELSNYSNKVKQLVDIGDCHYPIRFCLDCYRKESRRRRDMQIYWKKTNVYSIRELRFIQLKKIIKN